jgi:hypothetical protein
LNLLANHIRIGNNNFHISVSLPFS